MSGTRPVEAQEGDRPVGVPPSAHSGLGDFLRSRRDSLTPDQLGLAPSSRRRVRGLRREEIAGLAGVSVDYYTRLEQGTFTRASVGVIERLGSAMRLSNGERQHLRLLAGLAPRPSRLVPDSGGLRALELLVSQVDTVPVVLLDRFADIKAWSSPAATLLTAPSAAVEQKNRFANYAEILFLDNSLPRRCNELDGERERATAILRRTAAIWPHEPRMLDLVRRLSAASPSFASGWRRYPIADDIRSHPIAQVDGCDVRFTVDSLDFGADGGVLLAYLADATLAEVPRWASTH